MDHIPSPKELRTAARACTFLAYAVGLAGVAGGTLMLREEDLAMALILYTVTFAVGAALMGVAVLVRAVAGMMTQLHRIDGDVRVLVSDRARNGPAAGERDPWSGHHPPY
ncbi:MAG TPA: hypothetical protein VK906_05990 [Egicoccus sp.]|nr:hypothetical protein [Egicoccus sp.]HSK22703.1 hypothetical protein [Egicoccus sp.]